MRGGLFLAPARRLPAPHGDGSGSGGGAEDPAEERDRDGHGRDADDEALGLALHFVDDALRLVRMRDQGLAHSSSLSSLGPLGFPNTSSTPFPTIPSPARPSLSMT